MLLQMDILKAAPSQFGINLKEFLEVIMQKFYTHTHLTYKYYLE